jgi:hypothetical protein
MKHDNMYLTCLIVVGLLLMLWAPAIATEQVEKPVFVDYDGDGFNDLFADDNSDAIPDRYQSKAVENLGEVESALGDVFNAEISISGLEELRPNSEEFDLRSFRIRALSQRCCAYGSDSDFGPGNDIGLGAGSGGGGCAGGRCTP